MPGSRKHGKRAKWIRWEVKRPGVAPCEGHFEIYARKWQRQLTCFEDGLEKNWLFFLKSYRKNLWNTSMHAPEHGQQLGAPRWER